MKVDSCASNCLSQIVLSVGKQGRKEFRSITHACIHSYEDPETQFEVQMNYTDQSVKLAHMLQKYKPNVMNVVKL